MTAEAAGPRGGIAGGGWLHRLRRTLARLSVRLVLLNLLLVSIPLAGVFYFGVHELLGRYERELLDAQERSMAQQGRVLAAALAERAATPGDGGEAAPAFGAETAEQILAGLEQRTTARLRVWSPDGEVLADSSRLGPTREELQAAGAEPYAGDRPAEDPWLYRMGAAPFRLLRRLREAVADDGTRSAGSPSGAGTAAPEAPIEVRAALQGRYGASVRPSPGDQRSVTLHVAIPVRLGERVVGAAQASQSTYRILQDLRRVRLSFFEVFLASVAVAVVLSLVLGTTISRPVRRLRSEAAALVDRRGRLRGTFTGSRHLDEIGDLARALEGLSRRVEEHVRFVEAFAADVSHEFKNPLTSIRAATEMLPDARDPEERAHLLATVASEVSRMERLLTAVREVSLIDSLLEDEPAGVQELAPLLTGLVDGVRLRAPDGVGIALELPRERVAARGSADRLVQVFENLLDNALSFAPVGSTVRVRLVADGDDAVVTVRDEGPGIPPEHRDRAFDRFFTYRPGEGAAGAPSGVRHTGLGLSIVRAIVEGYGGSVRAGDAPGGGAELEVRLPRVAPGKIGSRT